MARPTDYNNSILVRARKYLAQAEDEEQQQLTGLSVKGTELYKNKLRVNLPSIEGLALYLGIDRSTIYDWESQEDKGEFSNIIGELRAKQARELINKGLSGDYNPTIAKVLLSKHGYKEEKDINLAEKKLILDDENDKEE